MANQDRRERDEWRLGIELGEPAEPAPLAQRAEPPSAAEQSRARLERPFFTVTAERAAWLLLGVYTLATRLIALDARPLDPAEARAALMQLAIAERGLDASGAFPGVALNWPSLAQAAVFAAFGAGDYAARITAAVSGVLLFGAAFAMRPHVGRAGAIGLAAMFALSPSFAYFARTGDAVLVTAAFAMLALVLFLHALREPTLTRAAGLGCALGLMLSAHASALTLVAVFALLLAGCGLWDAVARGNPLLRLRVWWERRRSLALICAALAVGVWFAFVTGFFVRPLLTELDAAVLAPFRGADGQSYATGVAFYGPLIGFYEFSLGLAALAGLIAIAARRGESRFAVVSAAWLVLALAAYPLMPVREPAWVLLMLLPMAIVGAHGVEILHVSRAWPVARIVLGVLPALTLYVQVLTSFVFPAPDGSEAAWNRRALLFWRAPATTYRARAECRLVVTAMRGEAAGAYVPDDLSAMRWYLRPLAPAADADDAGVVVEPIRPDGGGAARGDFASRYEFVLDEKWTPDLSKLDAAAAIRYLLTARPWNDVETRDAIMVVRVPSAPSSPTVILTPSPEPTPPASPPPR